MPPHLKIINSEEKYITSYWQLFDRVSRERKFFSNDSASSLEDTSQFVKHAIKNGFPQLFVIDTTTDACVGWCDAMGKTTDIGYLGIGLAPEYRDLGLGRELLTQTLALAKEFGFKRIELDVLATNHRAIHLYETFGFTSFNYVKDGYTWHNPTETGDIIEMVLLF